MRRASRAAAGVLVAGLSGMILACNPPDVGREVPPRAFVGRLFEDQRLGIVFADSVDACVRSEGFGRFFPLNMGDREEDDFSFRVVCARVLPLTGAELVKALPEPEGTAGPRGVAGGNAVVVARQITHSPADADWIWAEFLLGRSGDVLHLVERSHGSDWGREVVHSYRIERVEGRRTLRTLSSRERSAEFEPGPRAVLAPTAVGKDEGSFRRRVTENLLEIGREFFGGVCEVLSDHAVSVIPPLEPFLRYLVSEE